MKRLPSLCASSFLLAVMFHGCSTPEPDALIRTSETFGCETEYFFYDLKGNPGGLCDSTTVHQFFGLDGMNGVRISIYGDDSHGGHPAEGVVESESYEKVLHSIRNARAEAGEKGITVFASKKLMGKNSFPDWVMEDGGVNPEKYVSLIMDFFRYMRSEGVTIDVLGVDNELNFNEGDITPERFVRIVDLLKVCLQEEGFDLPQFIAPERYNPQEESDPASWLNELYARGWSDRLDIYGTHYYPRHHKEKFNNALRHEIELSRSDRPREFWATEPHWGVKGQTDNDPFWYDALSTCALFDQTDLGMNAMMWWGYNLRGDRKSHLMRTLGLTLLRSTPIRVEDHDGEDILDMTKLQTRAFLRGREVNLFVINVNTLEEEGTEFEGYRFSTDCRIKGDVTLRRWTEDGPAEGEVCDCARTGAKSFSLDIPCRSITLVTFKLK